MNYVAAFFAGVFLCNCLPHLLCGLQGAPFPTPFAKPRGVGDSPALVNFLWGSLNLFIGALLLFATKGFYLEFAAFFAGFLVIGALLSLHFSKVRKNHPAK